MEFFDLYDVNRIKINKTLERGTTPPDGCYRMVVHLVILNGDKMLIQQRVPFARSWPNMWDLTCGGSAIAGETSQQAMHREALEELGLDIDFSKIRPIMSLNFESGWDDVYIIEKEIDLNSLKLQPEEVNSVRWATKEEIKDLIEKDQFILYRNSYIDFIFEKRSNLGRPKK